MVAQLQNKDGQESAYSLACGHVQYFEINNIRVSLYKESNVYHVSVYDYNKHKKIQWDVLDKLTDARKLYRKLKKSLILNS